MKLLDLEETIVVVTGSTRAALERDRPLAVWLRDEIDRRADGQAYRRAVLTDDESYFRSDILQRQTTIAIGGPGSGGWTRRRRQPLWTRLWCTGIWMNCCGGCGSFVAG